MITVEVGVDMEAEEEVTEEDTMIAAVSFDFPCERRRNVVLDSRLHFCAKALSKTSFSFSLSSFTGYGGSGGKFRSTLSVNGVAH